jgi:endonuclease IV
MKIGVKTFDSADFLKHFEKKVDFFEIMALQKNDYSFLKDFSLPIVIHAEHQVYGTNIADSTKREFNLKSINFARKIADSVNAKIIIVHPGVLEKGNKNCSIKNAINFLKEIDDDRIILENLPKEETFPVAGISVGFTPLRMKKLLKQSGKGFCFDVNHAFWTRRKIKISYSFIKKYLRLNPSHYHIGGQTLKLKNQHTCFEDSDINLKEILKYYPKDAWITLETENDIKKVDKDLEIIRKTIEELDNFNSVT